MRSTSMPSRLSLPRRRRPSIPTATCGRTGTTPHEPRSRPSTRKGENDGVLRDGSLIDSFEADTEGLIRARREDVFVPVEIGQVVSVDCDEVGGFARVVKFEGDAETGWSFFTSSWGRRPSWPPRTWSSPTTTGATRPMSRSMEADAGVALQVGDVARPPWGCAPRLLHAGSADRLLDRRYRRLCSGHQHRCDRLAPSDTCG